MIHVQIASQVTATGVDGIRWVLLDEPDAVEPAGVAPAVLQTEAASPALARRELRLDLLKLALLALGLGLALGLAQRWLGPPTVPGLAPASTELPAAGHHPPAGAAPLAPRQAASTAGPVITAESR